MRSDIEFLRTPEFLADIEHNTQRWDKEWIGYWSRHESYAFKYFLDLSSKTPQDFHFPREGMSRMSAEELYNFKPFKYYPLAIWVEGALVPDSTIVELGCGPGQLGKVIAHFCNQYIGIDYSKLALYVAKLVSPSQCRYLHLSQYDEIEALGSSVDICVGRFFFGHQNLRNSLWILTLFNYLLRPGGIVSADFYASSPTKKKPMVVLSPEDELSPEYPSAVVEYTEDHIRDLAARCGFTIDKMFYRPEKNARFAIFVKPQKSRLTRNESVFRLETGESVPPAPPTPAPVMAPPEPRESAPVGDATVVEFTSPLEQWLGPWNRRTEVKVLAAEDDGLRLEAGGTQDTSAGQYAGIRFALHGARALRLELSLANPQDIRAVLVDGRDRAGSRIARWRWPLSGSTTSLRRESHLLSAPDFPLADPSGSSFLAEDVLPTDAIEAIVEVEVFLLLRPGGRAGMVLHRAEVIR